MDGAEIKKDTKIVATLDDGTDAVVELTCIQDCPSSSTTSHFYACTATGGRHGFYLNAEGTIWVRGWTGKIVAAFKRTLANKKRERQLAKTRADRARDKEHADHLVRCLRLAADVVKRAKLPRELRVAAFAAQFPGSMLTYMAPFARLR